MNIENTFKVTLYINKNLNKPYVQFIEAGSIDQAIERAHNSFNGRLYNLGKSPSIAQKACNYTIEGKKLTFGFRAGHITINPKEDSTIFDMYQEAKNHHFVNGEEIKEVHTSISEYM